MAAFFKKLVRRKQVDFTRIEETKLSRCLTTLDLTALGIGSTLGAGIYVVAGQVARETAGPSVMLSFLVAALASVFAGLCYAEFGARVPKTGSAYVYSYLTVGELLAFIIGWNLILEYVIGTASVARAWSAYFDTLIDKAISNYFKAHIHMNVPTLSEYPDFFALGITLLLTVILAVGVKESSRFNNIFTGVNLLVIAYCVICGMFKADIKNWTIPQSQVPNSTLPHPPYGTGGYFPYGVSGMLSGAATCFYAFVGFDAIATTGEEVQNPQKAIPISIIISLTFCFIAYFGVSAILTLMSPYFELDPSAPLPVVFDHVGWKVAKYVIAVGAVCGLSTSLIGAMFPMPRVIYAMAEDGLIFRFLARVSDRFKTPLIATIISGIMAGVGAMLFDLKELVDMMSIGTLLAYTLVAISVLILRYQSDISLGSCTGSTNYQPLDDVSSPSSSRNALMELFSPSSDQPTLYSSKVVNICVGLLGLFITLVCVILIFALDFIMQLQWWALLILIIASLNSCILVLIIFRQPQNTSYVTFKVPCLPFVPAISMFVNIYLMLKLSPITWIRFGVWMAIGFLIYFGYGIWHSSENKRPNPYGTLGETLSESDSDVPPASTESTNLHAPK